MTCKLCGDKGKINAPLGFVYCSCEEGRKKAIEEKTLEHSKCEYCGEGFQNWNIGKLLGEEDKWGCNSCCDKLVRNKK